MPDSRELLEIAKRAALDAGTLLRDGFGRLKTGDIQLKGFGDYVTAMDQASENLIIDFIRKRFPEHRIHAEESGADDTHESEYCWLIDPLDGTANYVHGIPFYSVSIAIQKNRRILAGVVYHVEQNELFSAENGGGAFRNNHPIHVSQRKELDEAMLGTGFPWRSRAFIESYMGTFHYFFLHSAGMRRLGSAALDLSYVACGRLDGFWEMHLRPYDIGAGLLIVEEAGGIVTDFQGNDTCLETGNVVAGNRHIHPKLVRITQQYLEDVPGFNSMNNQG